MFLTDVFVDTLRSTENKSVCKFSKRFLIRLRCEEYSKNETRPFTSKKRYFAINITVPYLNDYINLLKYLLTFLKFKSKNHNIYSYLYRV